MALYILKKREDDCFMKRVLMLEPIRPIGFKMLEEAGVEVVVAPDRTEKTAASMIDGFDGVITRTTYVGREIIDNGTNLKVIGRHGAGLDIIDLDYAKQKGVQVESTPGANAHSVAEYVIALMITMSRRVVSGDAAMRIERNYSRRNEFMGNDLKGKTLGIIGLGRIGKIIANIAVNGFNMNVLGYDPYISKESLMAINVEKHDNLDDLFKASDFLTLNCLLTDEVRNLINYENLKKMKPTAFIINCARGAMVVEEDLAKALENKIIAGAALDVFQDEPPMKDNPLFNAPNLIATPHIATMTHESMDNMSSTLVSNMLRAFGME